MEATAFAAKTKFGGPEQRQSPGKKCDEKNGDVEPERLDVLEFGSDIAPEIMFDEEDANEIGIAAGASDVPGESREAESGDGDGMEKAEGVAPAYRKNSPEEDRTAREN